MADDKGYIDVDKLAEFKPTPEIRYEQRFAGMLGKFLQQKWTNELKEEDWRDVPTVDKA